MTSSDQIIGTAHVDDVMIAGAVAPSGDPDADSVTVGGPIVADAKHQVDMEDGVH